MPEVPSNYNPTPKSPDISNMFVSAGSFNAYSHLDIGQKEDSYFYLERIAPGGVRAIISGVNANQLNNGAVVMTHTSAAVKWYDIRKLLQHVFLNIGFANLYERIKLKIMRWVPVRSGKLLDTILNTLNIIKRVYYGSNFLSQLSYVWNSDRPYPVTPNVKHSGQVGYGEFYQPRHTIPNRKLIKKTSKNGALWLLNDPMSVEDPTPFINNIGIDEIENQVVDAFNTIKVVLKIGGTKKRGPRISVITPTKP
ncbi:hypothetical protein [Candidatus Lokiarchaeum ossiferum]|uniref:hypothetical protein n=1 Tax=Candidatus Lokiarchaeum ossiferum TaxID=2951803 RepID=UPI00352F6301